MHVLGLDIGGANIKLATSGGYADHRPFALWQNPSKLGETLSAMVRRVPDVDRVVITMTGELTDCFDHKQQGVEFIVNAAREACGGEISVYLLDGRFVSGDVAMANAELAAASNWHALSVMVATRVAADRRGLLVDIGSTTTDLIPFGEHRVLARGRNDFERLRLGELVYTGVVRSPLNGIVHHLSHRGTECPVMNELFATTLDTNIVLGHLPQHAGQPWTADGGATSVAGCIRRLARLIGKDESGFSSVDACEMAEQIQSAQLDALENAGLRQLHEFVEQPCVMVISGQGEFLARQLHQRLCTAFPALDLESLSDHLNPGLSDSAPAWAIARLAASGSEIDQAAITPSID